MEYVKNDEEFEEDMKDELDSVVGLLDQMKEDRQQELMSTESGRFTRLERLKRSQQRDGPAEEQNETKDTTQVESRSRVGHEPVEVKVLHLGEDQNGESKQDDHREGQQKRKQDTVIAEIREKAEIISKSARKGPEDVVSTLSRTQHIEDDPEAAEYLKTIRDASATEQEHEKKEKPLERSAVTVDFPPTPRKASVTVKLNLDMQKSKIAVARGSGLQGRRKPTTEHRRRSLKLSDDDEPEDVLAKFDACLEEEMDSDDEDDPLTPLTITSVEASVSEGELIVPSERVDAQVMPQSPLEFGHKITLQRRGSFEGLTPRSSPKPRKPSWKSKTYGGVALPAFAEAMKAGSKSLKKTDTADKLLTADIVKQAAIDKLNRTAKEEKPEKEPEKPAWLAEAEARRKHHNRRRQKGDSVKIKPTEQESPPIAVRLKRTGSKLLEDVVTTMETPEVEDEEFQTNKIVFKLRSTGGTAEKPAFEPEPAKISFKLKPTGIQLVKAEEQKDKIDTDEPPVTATLVQDFETTPRGDDVEKRAPIVRLRHISPPKPPSMTKELESNEESELAIKLKLRGKAPPIHADEVGDQIYHGYHPPTEPCKAISKPIHADEVGDQIYHGYHPPTEPCKAISKPIHADEVGDQIYHGYHPPTEPCKAISKPIHADEVGDQIYHGYPSTEPRKASLSKPVEERKIHVAQTPTTYDKPKPTEPRKALSKPMHADEVGDQIYHGYHPPTEPCKALSKSVEEPKIHVAPTPTYPPTEPRKALSKPIHADGYPSTEPRKASLSKPVEERKINVAQTPTTYGTPKPTEPHKVSLSKPVEERKINVAQTPTTYGTPKPTEPHKFSLSKPVEERKINVAQTPTTYGTPKPIKVGAIKKPLDTAKLVSPQPMRTKAESTPTLSPTKSATKPFYKVTPIPSEPSTRNRGYSSTSSSGSRMYEQPLSPSSSRTFSPPMAISSSTSRPFSPPLSPSTSRPFSPPLSPSSSRPISPPLSPTSKVTVVSHHVEPTPSPRSVLPARSTRSRRVSGERAKTVAVTGSEVSRIIPGRTSSSDEPNRNVLRKTPSLEYPKSHVESAACGHLKHAVTVVKASNIPQKAKTMKATDIMSYRPRSPGNVLPSWKQELLESRRKSSTSWSDPDASARSWSTSCLSNKENEPRIVTQLEPLWMKELAKKKHNVYNLSSTNGGDIQHESMAAFERFEKPVKIVDSDDEPVREMPNFMKEFERKRRMKSRGFQYLQQSQPAGDQSYV